MIKVRELWFVRIVVTAEGLRFRSAFVVIHVHLRCFCMHRFELVSVPGKAKSGLARPSLEVLPRAPDADRQSYKYPFEDLAKIRVYNDLVKIVATQPESVNDFTSPAKDETGQHSERSLSNVKNRQSLSENLPPQEIRSAGEFLRCQL